MASETFNYTGGEQTWTVPDGVDTVTIEAYGAGGGTGGGSYGASGDVGGYAKAVDVPVTPGNTLHIYVGGQGGDGEGGAGDPLAAGAGGWNGGAPGGQGQGTTDSLGGAGGGGGGASDVRQGGNTLSDRIVVAGGGAGGGGGGGFSSVSGGSGGSGGGSTGQDGASADSGGGGGGTQSSGGSGGAATDNAQAGGDGSSGSGGAGGDADQISTSRGTGGGGGAGGYYGGGGGGGSADGAGGGGGGSAYATTNSSSTTLTDSGGNSGDGQVVLTYEQQPDNLQAAANTEDQIDLTWEDPFTAEDGFNIYRAQSSGGDTTADYTQIDSVGSNTTSYTDTGLEDGEQYFYRVTATDSDGFGESNPSNEAAAITILPAASSVSLDTSVEDEVTVSWTRNDDSTDGTWEILRSTDGSTGSSVASLTDLTTTSYTDTGLNDGEQYYYTVRRVTDHATADSPQQSGVTVLPAPTNLTAGTPTDTSIPVSWTNNHENGTERVEYKLSTDSSWTTFSSGLSLSTESETITGLLNGQTYDIRVFAVTEHTETVDTS